MTLFSYNDKRYVRRRKGEALNAMSGVLVASCSAASGTGALLKITTSKPSARKFNPGCN